MGSKSLTDQNFRPDIGYIQGMSYSAVFLLLTMGPSQAFQIFCTMIVSFEFHFKCFIFEKKLVSSLNSVTDVLVSKYFPNLFQYFSNKKINIWQIYMIEVSVCGFS
jgi:hypothetical protein